jgi:tetratricopeptide (TPR) repeat protein
MKHSKKTLLLLSTVLFLSLIACKNKTPKPNPALASIGLLRGELVLCGGDVFGEVSFSLSCSFETRETFDLAVSLLHSFEYDEAEKAFVQVLDADADCAMAYWGVAMSILNHPKFGPTKEGYKKAVKILEIAESLKKTTREQEYFDAINAYYKNDWSSTTHLERYKSMELLMEAMYTKYPNDKEAAIFYALSLFATADSKDKEYIKQKKAGKILESLFTDKPDHPRIAHYIIHHYDHPELAKLALSTARRYADIAPGSAHAQHMPSHIFTRLGLWDESIESNLKSASAAYCYAGETEMDGHWSREIHALDYLVYAYLQIGDNVKAMEQYEYLLTINKVVPIGSPYNFGAVSSRIYLENRKWEEAAKLKQHPSNTDWKNFPWEISNMHFARVLGAVHSGDLISAENDLLTLKSFQQELVKLEDVYRADQVMIQVKAAEAWLNFGKGNQEQALAFMQEAAVLEAETGKHPATPGEVLPAIELLGDMLLAMSRPVEALVSYEANLKRSPNRFNGLYGAAIAAKQSGNQEKATIYFEQLLKLVENSNSDRTEIIEAKLFVGENNS